VASVKDAVVLDLATQSLRDANAYLHEHAHELSGKTVRILNPAGLHSIAAGANVDTRIEIEGHAGYYAAGMNRQAEITIHGNAGCGLAENMMSGIVRVKGNASTCAGATAHGGVLVIEGDASSRCGISLKGTEIVVGGSVGHMTGFMAQAGRIVVCGDASHGLGDSLYEAILYVRGAVQGLGADAEEQEMTPEDFADLERLLELAGFSHEPTEFKRIGSARQLYHWNPDAAQDY